MTKHCVTCVHLCFFFAGNISNGMHETLVTMAASGEGKSCKFGVKGLSFTYTLVLFEMFSMIMYYFPQSSLQNWFGEKRVPGN